MTKLPELMTAADRIVKKALDAEREGRVELTRVCPRCDNRWTKRALRCPHCVLKFGRGIATQVITDK